MNKILFVDFNGVISYDNYWQELLDSKHPLHSYIGKIEDYLFKQNPEIIKDWMLGKYSSKQIHSILEVKTGAPADQLFKIFERGCRNIDISQEVLAKVKELQKNYYCILSTGNMDCFDRFTLPSNPILAQTFEEIENSYNLGIFKTTNNGEYFSSKAKKLNVSMQNCVVIDDSHKVCATFENLGGKSLCTYGIKPAVEALSLLQLERESEYI